MIDSTIISENAVMKEKGGSYRRGRGKKGRKTGNKNAVQLKTCILLLCSEYTLEVR